MRIIRNRWMTPDGTVLESKHRHDYVGHTDKVSGEFYFVDGGHDYCRTSVNVVKMQDLSIYPDAPYEIIREEFMWKTYGRNGEFFPGGKWISLKEMEDDHIKEILRTVKSVENTYVEKLLKQELSYRYDNKE